jgi:hypothetical protein
MRSTDSGDLKSMKLLGFGAMALRAALLGAAVCVAFAVHVVPAMAGDDDDDDDEPSIEQKVIRGIMHGIGAVDGTEKGIDYRERSPLVVPPKLNLPPPETSASVKPQPNWPRDPDVEERRKVRRAEKNRDKSKEWGVVLTPEEMKVGTARAKSATNTDRPGNPYNAGGSDEPILSPSKLGFKGIGNIFGGDKPEAAPFPGEPARESLTQPPGGYQTPSPAYVYGLNGDDQKKASNRTFDPSGEGDIISQGRK